MLAEEPVLLTPSRALARTVCSTCLSVLGNNGAITCAACNAARFCSATCKAVAASRPEVHSSWLCSRLAATPWDALEEEDQDTLHFLLQVLALRIAAHTDHGAAQRYTAIVALTPGAAQGGHQAATSGAPLSTGSVGSSSERTGLLWQSLTAAAGPDACVGLSQEDVAGWVAREACNSFGVMAPCGPAGERRVRGGAIYPLASNVNHECLPNAARFDWFDGASSSADSGAAEATIAAAAGAGFGAAGAAGQNSLSNAALYLRTLHAIPAGEELTISYFPLHWTLNERGMRCREQYGFECRCPRCQEESTWLSEEQEDEGEDEGETLSDAGDAQDDISSAGDDEDLGDAVEVDHHQQQHGACDEGGADEMEGEARVDDAYISVFLAKYVCPDESCLGTMAPLPGRPDVCECNLCGGLRTGAQFLADLRQ